MVFDTLSLISNVCSFITSDNKSNDTESIDENKKRDELIKKAIKEKNTYVNNLINTPDVKDEIVKLKLQIKKLAEENYNLKKEIKRVNTRVDNANIKINEFIENLKREMEYYL